MNLKISSSLLNFAGQRKVRLLFQLLSLNSTRTLATCVEEVMQLEIVRRTESAQLPQEKPIGRRFIIL